MTPNDEPSRPAEEPPLDNDVFDPDSEEVLDIEPSDDSSASAIEGVELLDFLEDADGDGADEP